MKLAQSRLAVSTVDQIAAAELYLLPDTYFDQVREEYRSRRDLCRKKLQAIDGVVCSEPMGAFYIMARLPVDDAERFQTWLLEEFSEQNETVLLAPGPGFYQTPGCGRQEVRIAYVLEQDKLSRAIDLLALALDRYNSR